MKPSAEDLHGRFRNHAVVLGPKICDMLDAKVLCKAIIDIWFNTRHCVDDQTRARLG